MQHHTNIFKGSLSYAKLGAYKQKPTGGHGGTGGSVYLITDPTMTSLKMDKHHYSGQDGGRGGKSRMIGKNGKDVFVRVPCGVVVRRVVDDVDDDLGDLEEDDDEEEFDEDEEIDDFEEIEVEGYDGVDEIFDVDENGDKQFDASTSTGEEERENENGENKSDNGDNEEYDDDFDKYYQELLSSKRQRKRSRRRQKLSSELPSDYDQVVDKGIRAKDGMYYWGSAEDTSDENDPLMSNSSEYLPTTKQQRKTVFLADLDQPHTALLVAKGGKSGVGNQAYANRPYFANRDANAAKKATPGEGECTYLELELKLIADVGLVGFVSGLNVQIINLAYFYFSR